MKETLIICLLYFAIYVNGQSLVINEFMAKNTSTIKNEDGDFSDWIELYNTTNSAINLLNYGLSDDKDDLKKWIFPEITILPHNYILVFASGKNILDKTELHTNFKISSSGEALYLSNNIGTILDQTKSVSLSTDESYGRIPDGETNWFNINTPSPNSSNNSSNNLFFSHSEGFHTSSFSLIINSLIGDTIFYTLNGDLPTESANIYTDSIFIKNKNAQPNIFSEIPTTPKQDLISYKSWQSPADKIDKATILRCASYKNGIRTSEIYTKTFFVGNEIEDKYSLPVLSLITEKENLFNVDTGIYVPGVNFDVNDPQWTGNYFMQGDDWERNIHIEYFDKEGNLGFSQNAGVRIHGGKTRQASQKSFRLYARNEYGKEYFNYKLLPKRQTEKYKRFILRTTMGAWGNTIIKDVVAQNIASPLNIDYQEFQPVIVYLNGEYWGIQTIRDRIDERYIEYTHNIDKDLVEFQKWHNIDYNNLTKYIENNNLSLNKNYNYVLTKIDIDNYIDYTIAELFFTNYDWPSNNIKFWKEIDNGKWRWVLYDLDGGFGRANKNMLKHATVNDPSITWPNSPSSTFLFRNLLKSELFKAHFIERYAEILNNEFRVDVMKAKLDSIKKIYNPEMMDHIKRWNYPDSFNSWENDIESDLLYFLERRPCGATDNLMAFFDLTNFNFECEIDNTNNLVVAPNPNNGNFFLFNNSIDIINATITLTNINGQVVFKQHNFNLKKYEKKYFDLSDLVNNVFILQIMADNYNEQQKIIIMR